VMPFVLPGVVRIPDRNTFEEGAMLEPVNTVLKAINRLSLLPGDNVLVAGQGPIGLMFTRLLHLRGMNILATDLIDSRLKLAEDFGARWAVKPHGVLELLASGFKFARSTARQKPRHSAPGRTWTEISRLDAAVLAVPSDTALRQAFDVVGGGGQIMLFAHTKRGAATELDLAQVCVDEKDLIGSYSADFTLQEEVAELVFSRKLDVRRLITHRFPLDRAADAIALASKPVRDSLKVVVCASEELGG